jgi:hypothetical protein
MAAREKHTECQLAMLPVDAQTIILFFLAHNDLALFSTVSEDFHKVATRIASGALTSRGTLAMPCYRYPRSIGVWANISPIANFAR